MEFLVTMTTRVPDGTPEQAVADVRSREVTPLSPHPNDPALAAS